MRCLAVLLFLPLTLWSPSSAVAAFAGNPQRSAFGHEEEPNVTFQCAQACSLFKRYSLAVSIPNTTTYSSQQADYWSVFQSDVSPACFVEPTCAEDVAEILQIARNTNCPFAVKSGGHAPFTGASNIPGGITILLHKLNELSLSPDRALTRVGTGNLWIDIYDYLTPKDLGVTGGRVAAIGTGGLTLGGGISFFSGRYGWACDNVRNYELVTADSQIVQVNQSSYPDLYFALRGGGNNFGIVTRLDLETFPQGQMYGGALVTSWDSKDALVDALHWFGHRAPEDVDAAVWIAMVYSSSQRIFILNTELTHARNIANASILANFTSVPVITSTLRSGTNMSALARDLNVVNPNGFRESHPSHTFLLKKKMLEDIINIFLDEIEPIKDSVEDLSPTLLFQPITTNTMEQMDGNALGLNASDGPLLLMSLPWWWSDRSRDQEVFQTSRRILERCVQRSKEMGAFHPYIYQNYAAAWQDVFAGYGQHNLEQLRAISRKYDPTGVFQKLQPGYFKLW